MKNEFKELFESILNESAASNEFDNMKNELEKIRSIYSDILMSLHDCSTRYGKLFKFLDKIQDKDKTKKYDKIIEDLQEQISIVSNKIISDKLFKNNGKLLKMIVNDFEK